MADLTNRTSFCKVENSIQLMEEKNLPVKEAALTVGYQNLNHFYK
nr:hypothetical protein [uncultured Blautia sp.]